MLKTTVLSARNVGISLKKRQFLKLIRVFAGNKYTYHSDYQHLSYNAKNKCFSLSNDNALANIGCICGQNSHFVNIIHYSSQG